MLFCFLDTNIFLEFKTFDEVDWLKELGVSELWLVIPQTVIQELDRHKYDSTSQRRSGRSRMILKKIENIDDSDAKHIRDRVYLRVLTENPQREWYVDRGYDPDNSDDRIVGAVEFFSDNNPQEDVVLITDDTGPRLKAKARNVPTSPLREDIRLDQEADPLLKQVRQLQLEINQLRNAQPKLEIGFAGQYGDIDEEISFKIDFSDHAMSSIELERSVELRRDELKYNGIVRPDDGKTNEKISYSEAVHNALEETRLRGLQIEYPSKNDVAAYNKRLDTYLKEEYTKYLKILAEYKDYVLRMRELQLKIKNVGSRPADGIDILLHFHDGLILRTQQRDRPNEPHPPKQPEAKSSLDRLFGTNRQYLESSPHLFTSQIPRDSAPSIPRPPSLRIRKVNSYNVEWSYELLKHHHEVNLPVLFATFEPPQTLPTVIRVDYRITAENIADLIEGHLRIRLHE